MRKFKIVIFMCFAIFSLPALADTYSARGVFSASCKEDGKKVDYGIVDDVRLGDNYIKFNTSDGKSVIKYGVGVLCDLKEIK